jgi:hypothetical protein
MTTGGMATSGALQQLNADFAPFANLTPSTGSQTGGGSQALQQLQQEMQAAGLSVAGMGTAPASSGAAPASAGYGGAAAAPFAGGVTPAGFWDDVMGVVRTGIGLGRRFGLFEQTQEYEMQFLDFFLKGQVQDLIQKLYRYVNQYSQLVECIPLVTECVRLFGSGGYVKALAKGYEAFRCIQAKLG